MFLYIDPGTGSMLFTILVGILGAAVFGLRNLWVKLRFLFSGGKKEKEETGILPFVIFADDKRYWNIFGPICRAFDRRGQEAVYMTASPGDPALSESFEHVRCEFIGEGNRAYAKLNMLHADVLLSTTPGLEVYQWKRSRGVRHYCHILHAASDATLYRMFGLDYYDSVLLSGDYQAGQIRQLEQLRSLPEKELKVVGQPYMDELLSRLKKTPAAPHETTVLLAPSWGPSSILSRFGEQAIDALIATGYHLIIRPHPQSFTSEKELMDRLMKKYPDVEWNRDNDNFDVLSRSDLMISDFSGVIFDFALVFNKPVIYADTSFDKAPYDACWLEDETWTFSTLPKIGAKLTEDGLTDMKALIDRCLMDETYRQGRDKARAEAWAHIGESAELAVDFLMEKRWEICARKEQEAGEEIRTREKKTGRNHKRNDSSQKAGPITEKPASGRDKS